jgi:hypothetical protein
MDMYRETHPWRARKVCHGVAAFLAILAVTTPFVSYSDFTSRHDIRLLDLPAAIVLVVLPLAGLVVWPLLPTSIPRGLNIAGFIFSLLGTLMLVFIIAFVTVTINMFGSSLAQRYPDYSDLVAAFMSFVSGLFSFGLGFYCLLVVYAILTYSYFRGFRSFRRVQALVPRVSR